MAVLGAGAVSVAAAVIAVARVGGVPHRGVPIVALAVGAAPVVPIQARGLQRGRPAVRVAVTTEVAHREAPGRAPAP